MDQNDEPLTREEARARERQRQEQPHQDQAMSDSTTMASAMLSSTTNMNDGDVPMDVTSLLDNLLSVRFRQTVSDSSSSSASPNSINAEESVASFIRDMHGFDQVLVLLEQTGYYGGDVEEESDGTGITGGVGGSSDTSASGGRGVYLTAEERREARLLEQEQRIARQRKRANDLSVFDSTLAVVAETVFNTKVGVACLVSERYGDRVRKMLTEGATRVASILIKGLWAYVNDTRDTVLSISPSSSNLHESSPLHLIPSHLYGSVLSCLRRHSTDLFSDAKSLLLADAFNECINRGFIIQRLMSDKYTITTSETIKDYMDLCNNIKNSHLSDDEKSSILTTLKTLNSSPLRLFSNLSWRVLTGNSTPYTSIPLSIPQFSNTTTNPTDRNANLGEDITTTNSITASCVDILTIADSLSLSSALHLPTSSSSTTSTNTYNHNNDLLSNTLGDADVDVFRLRVLELWGETLRISELIHNKLNTIRLHYTSHQQQHHLTTTSSSSSLSSLSSSSSSSPSSPALPKFLFTSVFHSFVVSLILHNIENLNYLYVLARLVQQAPRDPIIAMSTVRLIAQLSELPNGLSLLTQQIAPPASTPTITSSPSYSLIPGPFSPTLIGILLNLLSRSASPFPQPVIPTSPLASTQGQEHKSPSPHTFGNNEPIKSTNDNNSNRNTSNEHNDDDDDDDDDEDKVVRKFTIPVIVVREILNTLAEITTNITTIPINPTTLSTNISSVSSSSLPLASSMSTSPVTRPSVAFLYSFTTPDTINLLVSLLDAYAHLPCLSHPALSLIASICASPEGLVAFTFCTESESPVFCLISSLATSTPSHDIFTSTSSVLSSSSSPDGTSPPRHPLTPTSLKLRTADSPAQAISTSGFSSSTTLPSSSPILTLISASFAYDDEGRAASRHLLAQVLTSKHIDPTSPPVLITTATPTTTSRSIVTSLPLLLLASAIQRVLFSLLSLTSAPSTRTFNALLSPVYLSYFLRPESQFHPPFAAPNPSNIPFSSASSSTTSDNGSLQHGSEAHAVTVVLRSIDRALDALVHDGKSILADTQFASLHLLAAGSIHAWCVQHMVVRETFIVYLVDSVEESSHDTTMLNFEWKRKIARNIVKLNNQVFEASLGKISTALRTRLIKLANAVAMPSKPSDAVAVISKTG